jgi:hypothetical protein
MPDGAMLAWVLYGTVAAHCFRKMTMDLWPSGEGTEFSTAILQVPKTVPNDATESAPAAITAPTIATGPILHWLFFSTTNPKALPIIIAAYELPKQKRRHRCLRFLFAIRVAPGSAQPSRRVVAVRKPAPQATTRWRRCRSTSDA